MSLSKIVEISELIKICNRLKDNKQTIVATGGVYDILHLGHVNFLEGNEKLGDVLVVMLNSDHSTKKIKGPNRPINNQRTRSRMVASLEVVDYVAIFEETTPIKIIQKVKPDIWVKGGDYSLESLPEAKVIKEYGGNIVLLPYDERYSVSKLVNKILIKKPIKVKTKESHVS
jgi:glycerol-3-phosphate cytidylyltransferase